MFDNLAAAIKTALRAYLVRHDCGAAIFAFGEMDHMQMLIGSVLSSGALCFALSGKTHKKFKIKNQKSKLIIIHLFKVGKLKTLMMRVKIISRLSCQENRNLYRRFLPQKAERHRSGSWQLEWESLREINSI